MAESASPKSMYDKYRIIGVSDSMNRLRELITKAAQEKDDTVLILGPRGSGKENIAQNIHFQSEWKQEPFIAANCAGIPEQLFESIFFGIKKGAFTGAVESGGIIGNVKNGTVFLDEIGDLSLFHQAKFLRFLNDKSYARVGEEHKPKQANVKIIAATNIDLEDKIEKGEFRADLYDRISSQVIRTQNPLKYPGDLICLLNYYVKELGIKLDPRVKFLLYFYDFPGSVRELQILIKKDFYEILEIVKLRLRKLNSSKLQKFPKIIGDVEILEEAKKTVKKLESITLNGISNIYKDVNIHEEFKRSIENLEYDTLTTIRTTLKESENLLGEALEFIEEDITYLDECDADEKSDLYYDQFGRLSNYGFSDEDHHDINLLRKHNDAQAIEEILRKRGESDPFILHKKLSKKHHEAKEKRGQDILEKRLRFYEIVVLAQNYKCSKKKIIDYLHIGDKELSPDNFKKNYHYEYPGKINYEVKTPMDVFSEIVTQGTDE
ncbi:MAG: sigma 54-interacting transcriptional regulator [Deltaproteobacteria bacterium]|nr:sigma 54-interacting transcriptional regulator [Deltaproteobacteria bacterium]